MIAKIGAISNKKLNMFAKLSKKTCHCLIHDLRHVLTKNVLCHHVGHKVASREIRSRTRHCSCGLFYTINTRIDWKENVRSRH